jgi:hypothetical protein
MPRRAARGRDAALAPRQGGPRAALLALVLAATATGRAEAQWTSPTGWHRLSVGAGPAEALSRTAPASRDGLAVMAAFELVAREHIELRFAGTLFEGTGDLETQLGGIAVDAVLFPWRGRLQPYAGVGIGAYQLFAEEPGPVAAERRRDVTSVAWTALLGARVRAGPLTPFVEWRRTVFDGGVPITRYAPVIIGLHF